MRDSSPRAGAKESVHADFSHGLQDFNTIIGNPAAPFLNKLASEGMRFTNYDAVDHPSEPNYLALFSGSEQGLGGSDTVPTTCLQARRWRANSLTTLETQLRASAAGEIFGAARA
jgi:hypothetical protein